MTIQIVLAPRPAGIPMVPVQAPLASAPLPLSAAKQIVPLQPQFVHPFVHVQARSSSPVSARIAQVPVPVAGVPSPRLANVHLKMQAMPMQAPWPLVHCVHMLAHSPSPGPLAAGAMPPPLHAWGLPALSALPLQAAKGPVAVELPRPMLEVPPALSALDMRPWLDAARSFAMNSDFDLAGALGQATGNGVRRLDLPTVMTMMKEQSAGKKTIQALADKLMLHRMLDNLGVPQLPLLLALEGTAQKSAVEEFVQSHLCGPNATDIIAKPSHQSNATGVLCLSQPQPQQVGSCAQFVLSHARQQMSQKAGVHESAALQSLRPGFMAQPKYQSVVGFRSPLELRVMVLWGKAHIACWWWGRNVAPGECPSRNAWLVRRPARRGELSEEDDWQMVHGHTGYNLGFNRALAMFERHISVMAATAEAIAVAFGAPFLRADFFVGSAQWGVRLNEVAYGCGCDYRTMAEDGTGRLLDDGPAIAQILQEGMACCQRRIPADGFLSRLGAHGRTYYDMRVDRLPLELRPVPPKDDESDPSSCLAFAVPDELCTTVKELDGAARGFRSKTFNGPARTVSAVPMQLHSAGALRGRSYSFVS
jgi:hypothetical protein